MSDTHKNVGLRITSDPDTTAIPQPGAGVTRREARMPLRLLLAADLVPQQRPSRTERLVRRVDAHGFAGLMEGWQPALRLDVPNQLSGQSQSLEIGLRFTSLKDFTPAGIARQVPALARLLAVRTEVHAGEPGLADGAEVGALPGDAGPVRGIGAQIAARTASSWNAERAVRWNISVRSPSWPATHRSWARSRSPRSPSARAAVTSWWRCTAASSRCPTTS